MKHPMSIRDITSQTFMLDLKIGLPSDNGFKHFLIIKNITNNIIDIEPMTDKTADSVIDAMETIFNRKYIKLTRVDSRFITDLGSEFVNSKFKSYCENKGIKLIPYNKYHYNSTSPIERSISTVTKILLEYLSKKSLELKRNYNRWVNIIPIIVNEINNHAEQKYHLKDILEPPIIHKNLYPLHIRVHKRLQEPLHLLNNRQKYAFRNGDRRYTLNTFEITDYRIRMGQPITYILSDDYRISYQHHELLPE